jgi:hypothetical protein
MNVAIHDDILTKACRTIVDITMAVSGGALGIDLGEQPRRG